MATLYAKKVTAQSSVLLINVSFIIADDVFDQLDMLSKLAGRFHQKMLKVRFNYSSGTAIGAEFTNHFS